MLIIAIKINNIMADKKFFNNKGPFDLAQLAELSGAKINYSKVSAPKDFQKILIKDVASLEKAEKGHIAFFANAKYKNLFSTSKAEVIICQEKFVDAAPEGAYLLIHTNPYYVYALICNAFYPTFEKAKKSQIHQTAIISESAKLGENVTIGANVYIGENVQIGDNTHIKAGAIIEDNCKIGENCQISNNVTISHTIMGDNNLILPNAAIGQDGFGFATENGQHVKVPQIGRVLIGNNVEIGAGTTIDRGSAADTIISDMCRIDNLVQIGHNVKLGRGCVIVSQVGVAGSTEIGDYSVLGGQVGVAGHLKIGSFVTIAAKAGIAKDIEDKKIMGGTPAVPIREWHKQTAILNKLVNSK